MLKITNLVCSKGTIKTFKQSHYKLEKMCSSIDVDIQASQFSPILWFLDLNVSACLGPAMDHISTEFTVISSSIFFLKYWQTQKQTHKK